MKIGLSFVFVFFSFGIFAQTASIEGNVYDRIAKSPLEFASVALYSLPDSVLINGQITSAGGRFKFNKLKAGSYFIKAQFVGYSTYQSVPIRLSSNQKMELGNLDLFLSDRFLSEVMVTGQQLKNVNKIDKQVYKADQFEAAKGGTAIDVIKNMPAISVDGQGEISLRGSKGFLVLINGKPIQTDATTILSQLPANALENVEVMTAPSAKYDPDGKGGIINITTKKGSDDGVSLIVNAQGGLPSVEDYNNLETQQRYGADLVFNYKKGKWDLSANANYLRNDNAGFRDGDVFTIIGDQKTSFPSQGERSFDKYNYGGRFNLGFNPSKNDQFSVGFFASRKYQDRLADIHYINTTSRLNTGDIINQRSYFNSNLQNKQGNFVLGNIDYTHTFLNKSTFTIAAIYEHADLHGFTKNRNIELADTIQNTLSTYKNPLNGFRAKLDYIIPVGTGKFETGYQYRLDRQDGQFIYSVKNKDEDQFAVYLPFTGQVIAENSIHSVYGQFSGKKGKLEYLGGLRYEHAQRDLNVVSALSDNHKLELNNLFPSASFLYSFEKNWKIKTGLSRRVQRTNNFELNPIPEREHSETLEQGDVNLLPEFIYLAEAGLSKNFDKGSWLATVYYQDIKNPIQRVNSVFADTILNRVFTNAEKARRTGLELAVNYNPAKWTQLYFGANLYKSTLEGLILNYPTPAKNAAWVHSMNANANFQLSQTWSLQANINYLSDRPTVQGEDSRFFSPNTSLKKIFMDGRFTVLLQWQNMDMGLWRANEQRITTHGTDFYTTTNYVYEVDVFMLNLSFNLNKLTKKLKLPGSEFGEKEF